VFDRLTLRPGIRYEQQELVGNLASFKWSNNWAPRIGATYDLLGNGRSKVFANWAGSTARSRTTWRRARSRPMPGVTRAELLRCGPDPTDSGRRACRRADATPHPGGAQPVGVRSRRQVDVLDEALVGVEWEVFRNTNLGVRYTARNFGRILEDIGTAPMAAYLLDLPGLDSVEYFITNVNHTTPVSFPEFGASFEDPIHDYDAVEVTMNRRFSDRWGLQGSYRWSRLYGNFEGMYRSDNDQSRPGDHLAVDFPTNDPSYAAIAVQQFGAQGDIRYWGAPAPACCRTIGRTSSRCSATTCSRLASTSASVSISAQAARSRRWRPIRCTTATARSRRRRAVRASPPRTASGSARRSMPI
jgi:hypothetical protein